MAKISLVVTSKLLPTLIAHTRLFARNKQGNLAFVAKEFCMAIDNAGLNEKQFEQGVEAIKALPPEKAWDLLPSEFVAMCRPTAEMLGLPDLDTCLHHITQCHGPWRVKMSGTRYPFDHFTRLVNNRVSWKFRRASLVDQKRMVKEAYEHFLNLAQKGQLPPPRPALNFKAPDPKPVYEQYGYGPDHPSVKAFMARRRRKGRAA